MKKLIGKLCFSIGWVAGIIYALKTIILVLILAAFIGALWNSSSEVQAGIIGFIAVVGVALYTHSTTKKREIEARHFNEKRIAYHHFVEFLFKLFMAQKNKKPLSEGKLTDEMVKFKQNLLIWGNASVIQSYYDYEDSAETKDISILLVQMEKLLRAIRADLGHDDRYLKAGSLVGLFLVSEDRRKIFEDKQSG